MRYLLLTLFLLPCFVFGQKTDHSYAIYSQYLKLYQTKKGIKLRLVVKESLDYSSKYRNSDLTDIVEDMRNYSTGKHPRLLYFAFDGFPDTLKKDTLWIPLIAELNKKLKNKFIIKNEFAPDLKTIVIGDDEFDKYLNNPSIQEGWDAFHHKYSKRAALIGLSAIANDGKRAVFYFESKYGGLGGEGGLVLFYKENSEWKFLMYLRIWQA